MRELSIEWDVPARRTKVRLRVTMAAMDEAARRLDLPAPQCSEVKGDVTALWLGPDQWLLVSDHMLPSVSAERCERELGSLLHHTVDLSAALACARLRGARVRELMAMASGVDWSTAAFPAGHCRRTRFARIAAIVHAVENDVIELYYDRSYRRYLERWFAHASSDPLFAVTTC
jgi:sarcosine oxidase subunit gamma